MTEVILFVIVGALAVAFAVVMLTSRNAVHSALSLVATMGALAFLFLLLDAPFLAMIQITVYAGAIMVLFIFVIMLLGAERLDLRETKFPWLPAVGLTLALALLFALALPILNTNLNAQTPPEPAPRVRVVHAATDVPAVQVALNDTVIASDLAFRTASDYIQTAAGDYNVTVTPQDGAPITTVVSLEPGTISTIIAYGDGPEVAFAVLQDDLSTVPEARSSRIVVFNAFRPAQSISLVDFGAEFNTGDTITYVNDLAFGAASAPFIITEGTYSWAYLDGPDVPDSDGEPVLFRQRGLELGRDRSDLIVVTSERLFDGTLRAAPTLIRADARASFGSPRAIGEMLFIDYMLPFQLLAILLLAAMVGVIVLTRHQITPPRQRVQGRRKVSRPLTNVIASQVGHEVVQTDAPQLPTESDQREPAGD